MYEALRYYIHARAHYLNAKAEKFVRPLAEGLGAPIILPCDVSKAGELEAVFERMKACWGTIDYVVHSIAFSPLNELHGRLVDSTAEGFGVVAVDGLKIEPLPVELTGDASTPPRPVRDFHKLYQELDERIELAMMEAMKREATASITIQIGIVPNLEQERADLTTSFDVKLPKITGGSAVVSVFAPTGKISVFGEKVTKKGGGRLAGEGRLTSIS